MGNLRKNLHEWIHSSDDRQQKIAINARREMQIYIDVTEDHSDELGPYR